MDALIFLTLTLLLTALCVGAMVLGYVGAGRGRDPQAHLAPLKRHLAEIDTQHILGLIRDEDHQRARAQAARRLIATGRCWS